MVLTANFDVKGSTNSFAVNLAKPCNVHFEAVGDQKIRLSEDLIEVNSGG